MKGRIVDILLIVTLVLVAFGITYTLLTLNRGQTRPPPEPQTPVQQNQTQTQGQTQAGQQNGQTQGSDLPVVGDDGPVVPDALQGNNDAAGQAGAGNDAADAGAAAGQQQDGAAADQDPVPVEPDAPPRVPIAGEMALETIGFSWVTGGAGACGVVLEPWEHVAVSRELLAELGCGATLTVHLDDPVAGRSSVTATVADTMNPVHNMTVNIYVGQNEPALEYGRNSGAITVP